MWKPHVMDLCLLSPRWHRGCCVFGPSGSGKGGELECCWILEFGQHHICAAMLSMSLKGSRLTPAKKKLTPANLLPLLHEVRNCCSLQLLHRCHPHAPCLRAAFNVLSSVLLPALSPSCLISLCVSVRNKIRAVPAYCLRSGGRFLQGLCCSALVPHRTTGPSLAS